jgi:putative membrane protein
MKNNLLLLIAGVALLAAPHFADAQPRGKSDPPAAEKDLVGKLAGGSLAEIKMGNLAQTNGQSQEVKDLGKTMANDHSKIDNNLRLWAEKKNVVLSHEVPAKREREFDSLKGLTGKDFDQKYTEMMLEDHQKDIQEVQDAIPNIHDKDLKALLSDSLPILENHMRKTEHVAGMIGVSEKKGLN